MIITRIKLDPFGGKTGTELNFRPGLNVILGPNEAGKSTVFSAVFAALFVPAKLGKRDLEKQISRFLPLGGGDTIRVELDFSSDEGDYRLEKSWGGTAGAELALPDGTVITEEGALAGRLSSLLGAGEGTYRSVLMTPQSGLGMTLPALREKYPATIRELDDILRSALLETDGISLDLFREKIEQEYSDYFDHWDRKEDYPEQGKGIEHPWLKLIGAILRAFYQRETLRKLLKDARRLEAELEEINRRIAGKKEKLEEARDYLSLNRQAVEDARERRVLAGELSGQQLLLKNLEDVNRNWPVVENRLAELKKKLAELRDRQERVAGERSKAEANEKNRALREKHSRVKEKNQLLEQSRIDLAKCRVITREAVRKIRGAETEIARLEAGLAAGQISLKLTAKKAARIKVQKDLAGAQEEELAAGQTLELAAGSRIGIEHPELSIEAIAGKRSFAEISEEYERAKKTHAEILAELGLAGLSAAESALRLREEAEGKVGAAQENLDRELGEYSYRELEEQVSALGPAGRTRPLPEVIAEDEKIKGEIRAGREEEERGEKRLSGYAAEYTDQRSLLLATAAAAGKMKELEDMIGSLTPLPEGVGDGAALIAAYQKREEVGRGLVQELNDLKIEAAGLTARLPEETEEDLEKRLQEAEEGLEEVKRAAAAIARIREVTETLVAELDRDTFDELKTDLEEMIGKLTGRRYREVAMGKSLPRGLVREDGQILTPDRLSVGTRDELALAVRLAMAKRFLKTGGGFLLLDDPLVDLDPQRQKAAAGLLKDFAAETQLLIFTCHPRHAEILGGNRIEL
ncbi:MAG: AAA family ATPase [Candidatus Erginobacter occultus]|nr:AAA family ATPase [Candidatus Erginobacter occultus]